MNELFLGARYKVLKPLSQGGFGTTYLAEDTQYPNNPQCVVKKLHSAVNNKDTEFITIARRLFDKEAQTLAKLGKHDQIPQLLAYFEENREFYLVQEYIEGKTLSHELVPNLPWTEDKVIEFLKDLLQVVDFVHQNGVIHRDIKPDNLIRRKSDNKLVLVDFGTVKEVIQAQTEAISLTVSVGTQGYMPTEQARGKPRYASDIYAVGMIAVQALTGLHPLQLPEDSNGELQWQDRVNCQPLLAEILTKMTRYHFKDRYSSAAEIVATLDPAETDHSESNIAPETVKNIQKRSRLMPLAIALGGLLLIGGSIFGGKYFLSGNTPPELKAAQQAAESGKYEEAIALTRELTITPAIQAQINDWSEQLVAKAQREYTQEGELAIATRIIQDIIPQNSPSKEMAVELLAGWKKEHEYNQSILYVAKEELQQERWRKAKKEAAKIQTNTPFWKNQAQQIIEAANLGIRSQPGIVDLCAKAINLCN